MLPADMGGGGRADLRRGLEALKTFKKRVDTVLANLEGSAGSSTKVADHRLSRSSFSGQSATFNEAADLFTQYNRVHDRLTNLSKSLGMHIESLGIAVHGADVGFDNLEEEQRRRFWEIQTHIDREHKEAELAKAAAQSGQPTQERSDDRKAEAGY